MNKNLKKVISAVAALAMSASTFTALAATFPDVPEDASYAQAVQELSALDVISGYDDGTFKPDELVTRAQITKMIVDALGERELAEASKANSQFADVNSAGENGHWAKGYINQGVTDKFIAGYDSQTFGPDDNVTYVQAQKMLVSAIGYETYAQESGGWPNGYKVWASSQGITDGISGIADDAQLTRAQVAQLVDNAMGAPTCTVTWETTILGNTPKLTVNDGTGKEFKSLFTLKHDAYKVFGRVTETSKQGSLDSDQVSFRVEKADNFNDQWIGSARNADEPTVTETMYVGDTNAADYLQSYAEALIQKDDNDEFTILSISAAAASKSVQLASEDFDSSATDRNKDAEGVYTKLYFYPAGTTRNSVKYAIANQYTAYVNGVERKDLESSAALVKYLDDNNTLSVKLEKQTNTGSTTTSTDYNLINITEYGTAIVSEVTERSDRITINFDDQSVDKSRMIVYLDDDTYSYSFKLGDEEIDPTDLQEGDVLSIAYDVKQGNTGFDDSSFYDVIVSRDVVEEARCSSQSDDEFTFDNGSTYKIASGMNLSEREIELSSTYTLYLDHFGRIAKVDESAAYKKLAILKNVYKKAGGDYYAQLITKEGDDPEYKVDTDVAYTLQTEVLGMSTNTEKTPYADGVEYASNTKIQKYPNQVIEYTVSSSSNKLNFKKVEVGTPSATVSGTGAVDRDEYRASSMKIGAVKLSDSSVILDLSEVENDEFDIVTPDTLTDGNSYAAVGYDESKTGTRYHRFVILLSGNSEYTSETQLAVIRKVETTSDDDTTKVQLQVAHNGEEETYIVDDSITTDATTYYEGEPIIFTTNAAGYIKKLTPVFKNTEGRAAVLSYGTMRGYFNNGTAIVDTTTDWNNLLKDGNSDTIDIVSGVVVNKVGSNIVIGDVKSATVAKKDGSGTNETLSHVVDYDNRNNDYSFANAKIYTYDFDASTSRGASKVAVDDGIMSTPTSKTHEYVENGTNHTVLNLDAPEITDDIVFAVARVDRDEIQELYLFYQEN